MTVCGSPPPPLSPAGDDQPDRSSTGPNPKSHPLNGHGMEGDTVLFDPGPRPSVMPKEANCFTMTLTSFEVAGPNAMIRLTTDDVYNLTESDELQMNPPAVFSRDLLVIDSSNRHYMMNVSNRETGSPFNFLLNSEWHEFALSNRLREKDTLMFYKFLHNATGRIYYRLDFFKAPTAPPPSGDPSDDESCCLSKTLTASQVDPLDPMFLIGEQDAFDLTACEDFLESDSNCSKSLIVNNYDPVYFFELSPFFANKCFVGYRICGGWADFVKHKKLEVGDRIFFLIDQENKSELLVYEIRILRKNPLPSDDVYTFDEVTSEEKIYPYLKMKPGPGSSDSADDDSGCLSRTLTAKQVDPIDPMFLIDERDAYDLTGDVNFLGSDSSSLSMSFIVEHDDTGYSFDLSPFYVNEEFVGYRICGDWALFVEHNKLEVGDRIFISTHEENKTDELIYTLKILRKNHLPSEEKKYPDLKRKPGPGCSMPPANSICLSRPLTAFEVVHAGGKPRLFLDSFSAHFFMAPHGFGTLKENLVVFDDRNRQYDMLLSQLGTKLGDMEYVVDAGWQRFVKTHNLKAGDRIKIYRRAKNMVDGQTSYVAKYERKISIPIGRAVRVAGPSGSSGNETGPCGSGADPARSNGTSLDKGKGVAY